MDQWWQIIFEWINCLNISNNIVKHKCDFQDGYIYKKIIEIIGVWKTDSCTDVNDLILSFIKEEYPEFMTNDDILSENYDVYIASLFLLRASQEPEFQSPMSTKLQHETQLKIKMFLETVLPYGRHVTTDVIEMAINELIDENPLSPNKTPKKRPLREFFTSPAAVSAQKQRIVNERNRQICHLRSELETERCEKAYLQDDLKSREEKIKNLQAKLQLKNEELKSIRNERFNAYTPQSCKKSRDSMEQVYKTEIDSLEAFISKLQKECETMESEKEDLKQKISVLKIKLESCEDKSSHFEKQSEMLLAQMELKDREIVELRMQNEEYRNLIKEMKCSEELSFECEEVVYNKGRASANFNTSEIMSSVVEVQLLEVQKECEKLRVELDAATKNLNNANTENRGLKFTNEILKEKVENMDQLAEQLQRVEWDLKCKISEVSKLENELMVLTEEFKHAKDKISNKEDALKEAERNEKALKNELNKLTARLQILDGSMRIESERVMSLKSTISTLEQEKVILSERLKIAEDNLFGKESELKILEENEKSLKNDMNKFIAKIQVLEESLKKEETKSEELGNTLSVVTRDNLIYIEKLKLLEKHLSNTEDNLKITNNRVLHLEQEIQNLNILLSDEKRLNNGLNAEILRLEQIKNSLSDESSALKSQLAGLNQELNNKVVNIEELKKKTERLILEMKSLEMSLKEQNDEISSLKCTILQLETEKENVSTQLQDTKLKLVQETNQLEKSNEFINQLQFKVDEIEIKLKSKEDLLKTEELSSKNLKSEIENLIKEKSTLLDNLEAGEEKLVALNDLLVQAKQNIETRNKDISNLENSLKKMEEFLAGERSEKAYLHTIIEKLENRERSLSENLSIVKAELNEKFQSLLSAMEDINKLKTGITILESSKQNLEENLKAEKLSVNDLRNTLTQMENEHKKIVSENVKVKDDIKTYESLTKTLYNEIDMFKKEVSNLNEELFQEKYLSKDLQNSVDVLQKNKNEMIVKLNEYESLDQQYKIDIEKLHEEIIVLNGDVSSRTTDLIIKNKNITDLNATILNLERSLFEKENFIDEQNRKILDFESTINETVENLKNIILKGSQLIESNFTFYTKINVKDLCEELRKLMHSIEKLVESKNEIICMRESEIEEQVCTLKTRQKDISNLEEKISNMNSDIIDMSKEIKMNENLLADFGKREMELQKALIDVKVVKDKALKEKCLCVEELETDCKNLRSSVKFEKEKNLALEGKCLDLENYLKIEKNSINELKMKLSQCQNELKESKEQYNEIKLLNDKTELTYSDLHSAIKEMQGLIFSSVKEESSVTFEDKIKASIEIIVKFKENFNTLKNECKALHENLSAEKVIAEAHSNKLCGEIEYLKSNQKKYESLVSETLKKTELFQMLLSLAMKLRHEFEDHLQNIQDNWSSISIKYESVLNTNNHTCNRLKQLLIQKEKLDQNIAQLKQNHFENAHFLLHTMHKSILWTEKKLKNGIFNSEEDFESLHDVSLNASFSSEESMVNADIERNKIAFQNMQSVKDEIELFVKSVELYNEGLRTGEIKLELVHEEKLKIEVEKLNKDKKDLKDKLDNMRTRNAKLEKNIDSLRNEIKTLKEEQLTKVNSSELSELNKRIQNLEEDKDNLHKEKKELEKEKEQIKEYLTKENENIVQKYDKELEKQDADFKERMKNVYADYEAKLDYLKQFMKTAFNEQMTKLKQEQEKAIEEKVNSLRTKMEQQCRKHTEEINKYKNHVSELSTQYWDIGEKLILEKQEKEQALQQLQNLRGKFNEKLNDHLTMAQRTMSLDRKDFSYDSDSFRLRSGHSIQVIEEETISRRHSVKSIQAMGNPFNAEDEEGEIFDNNYLADLKDGRQRLPEPDLDRLSVLQRRNTLCKPHLKSSYPAETQFQPIGFSEEEIKTGGGSEEVFNDSLSQSLLPGQKPRKKDRTQPSYKRPGPPTPSKNGGRLSLQGNELPRSPTSKILKERNSDRRTTVTPRRLKNLFGTSKKQDENGTPRSRISIFRKQRPTQDKL